MLFALEFFQNVSQIVLLLTLLKREREDKREIKFYNHKKANEWHTKNDTGVNELYIFDIDSLGCLHILLHNLLLRQREESQSTHAGKREREREREKEKEKYI